MSKEKKRRALENTEAKHVAYSQLLMRVIDDATTSGVQPHFIFDSEKDSEADQVIHAWARDVFQGSQINLLFGYLAKGIEIAVPVFVTPASKPCLEVADLVSYVIARHCFRKIKGRPIDLDPRDLGPVVYIGFESNGDSVKSISTGYPWREFYGDV